MYYKVKYHDGPWEGQEHETTVKPVDMELRVRSNDVGKRDGELWKYEVSITEGGVTHVFGKLLNRK